MKAILFSNFPKDVFNNTLKPKFDQYDVEIVKVANIDRSPNIDIGDAEVIVAMVELMSSGQRAKIKELARRNNKRFIALSRKGADWAREFAAVDMSARRGAPNSPVAAPVKMPFIPMVVPPPPPSEPEPVPETESDVQLAEPGELVEMLSLFEQENERLEERVKELEARDRSGVELELVRRLQKADDELRMHKGSIERLQVARDQQVQEVRKLKEKLVELESQHKNAVSSDSYKQLSKKFDDATRQLDDANARISGLLPAGRRNAELEKELQGARQQVQEHVQFVANAQREVKAFQETIENLRKQNASLTELGERQGEELYKIRQENEQLRKNPALYVDDANQKKLTKRIEELEEENERLRTMSSRPLSPPRSTVKANDDFIKLRDALSITMRMGAMSGPEVLEKLMNWKPKEEG